MTTAIRARTVHGSVLARPAVHWFESGSEALVDNSEFNPMGRLFIFIYGIVSYAVGLGGLTFFMLFIGGWEFLPIHVDSRATGPLGVALLVNTGLIALFGLQHSVMARPGFKAAWVK